LERAYIAFGANLGDRRRNLAAALDYLRGVPGVRVLRVSSLLENPAVGGPAVSPPFLNGVVEIETSLPARGLLQTLLRIERELGRVRHEKWEPRIIDLDLLVYGQQVLSEPDLIVPHPRMHERRFVLQPLAEIAPDLCHPVLGKTISHLLAEISVC
jgi:2-amino-4-hydroxy-6-hydroxymethyldihydropteridine diphosphokinase